jgi:hypothetical protein
MWQVLGSRYSSCDGLSRRSFLRIGSLGLAGLTLPNLLRQRAAGAARTSNDTAAIVIFLGGGHSHIDMYDLKPNAPAEYRGDFKPIATRVPGIQISEHLPRHAAIMDKLALVRSVTHTHPGHGGGPHWMMTGYNPVVEINDNHFPSIGSIVARVRGANRPGLPAYVSVPRLVNSGNAAYLGVACNPFVPGGDPNDSAFQVRDIQAPPSVDAERLANRRDLLRVVDRMRRDVDLGGTASGFDQFYREAQEMVTNQAALRAFEIGKEPDRLRDAYGRNSFGQCCLLARRLVEAGVTFVAISSGGWDTHKDNFKGLKDKLLPVFDQGFASLVEDLHQRGLERNVLVFVISDFGRTPKINKDAGRDHWPGANTIPFAGGGLKVGQVVGATDSRAEYPRENPQGPQDVLATVYHFLGVDTNIEFISEASRPIKICNVGKPIAELVK